MDMYQGIISTSGLVVGLVLLWWAGSRSVHYSVQTARTFGLGRFFLGFVLMAVSTGIPELAVALTAVFKGAVQLSAGDILGSNLHDISMVIGIPLLCFGSITIKERKDRMELLVSLGLAAGVMALVFVLGELGWRAGLALMLFYCVHLVWLARLEHPAPAVEPHEVPEHNAHGKRRTKFFNRNHFKRYRVVMQLAASLGLVALAAHMAITMALRLAGVFGIPLETLGVSFFAFASSLPELTVSWHAIRSKEYSLALGNAIGSVFQQGTFILGLLALTSRTRIDVRQLTDIVPFMFTCFALLGISLARSKKIGRPVGAAMVCLYLAFIIKRVVL